MNALIKKGMLVTALAMSVNTAMAAQSIDIKVTDLPPRLDTTLS
ncbi:hypothetical protein [Enterobacter cloacae]|nr:hypothetical protein [Enterobacter cloacae]MCQ4402548.1 hypothetical protein [Enterobacter cloacae]